MKNSVQLEEDLQNYFLYAANKPRSFKHTYSILAFGLGGLVKGATGAGSPVMCTCFDHIF